MVSPLAGSIAKQVYGGMKGIFLDATLTRGPAPTGPSYDPTFGASVDYSCKAIAQDYSTGVQGTGIVAGSDISIIILANSLPVGFEPQSNDRLAIPLQGIAGTIVPESTGGLRAVMSDPARATWTCRVIV